MAITISPGSPGATVDSAFSTDGIKFPSCHQSVMANRKSASKQATGGASRSLNPQLANRNRFASIGNRDYYSSFIHLHCTNVPLAGNTSSKPLTSPNQSSRSKVQTRKSSTSTPRKPNLCVLPGTAPKPPQPQVAANHSSNGTKCKALVSTLSTTIHVLHLSSRYQ